MIHIKSPQEILTMKKAGKILGEVLETVMNSIEEGMTELEIDSLAERLIREKGGESGFKKVPGYHHTICISVNDVVVHGIPTARKVNKGDIIGVDCGVYLDGFHTDMAETILLPLGNKSDEEKKKFLKAGKDALFNAIFQVKAGNRVGDVSIQMQNVEKMGYSIVKSLVGHGVGRDLHEDPEIPGFLAKPIRKTPLFKENMTVAVEIIYNMGSEEIVYSGEDDWTIVTKDKNLSGLFERSMIVTKNGPELLTRFSTDPV